MFGSIVIVGVLTHVWLHSVYDLKTAQMNMQYSLIWKFMLYKFKLGHNILEATKNICCAKDEGTVDCDTVIRLFKKFRMDWKNLDNKARLGRPKTIDWEAMLQIIEANLASSAWRVSGDLSIS